MRNRSAICWEPAEPAAEKQSAPHCSAPEAQEGRARPVHPGPPRALRSCHPGGSNPGPLLSLGPAPVFSVMGERQPFYSLKEPCGQPGTPAPQAPCPFRPPRRPLPHVCILEPVVALIMARDKVPQAPAGGGDGLVNRGVGTACRHPGSRAQERTATSRGSWGPGPHPQGWAGIRQAEDGGDTFQTEHPESKGWGSSRAQRGGPSRGGRCKWS